MNRLLAVLAWVLLLAAAALCVAAVVFALTHDGAGNLAAALILECVGVLVAAVAITALVER